MTKLESFQECKNDFTFENLYMYSTILTEYRRKSDVHDNRCKRKTFGKIQYPLTILKKRNSYKLD